MKLRLQHFLILLGVIISFTPILLVDFFLDSYVKKQSLLRFNDVSKAVSEINQNAVFKAIASLDVILKTSPSLCTPTFITNVQKQLQLNSTLAQVVVENKDTVQYCDAYNGVANYSVLSNSLPMPNRNETFKIVQLENNPKPSFMISRSVGSNRTISAFVHVYSSIEGVVPNFLIDVSSLKIQTTDGGQVISLGKRYSIDEIANDKKMIVLTSVATALPIMTQLVIPFDAIRSSFADADIFLTLFAILFGGIILLLLIKTLNKSNLPAIDLERAITQQEFKPYYQPIIDINTGRLVGCEALMRWVKKNGEVVAPGMFIDYAESSGLAFPMTISLMKQIVKDLGQLCQNQPDIKIGINLFEGHFRDTGIVEDVKTIFGKSKINYNQLVFEITERKPLKNQLAVSGVIGGLQALGCKMAMDDAGTGHSNLAYMQTLNVDIIKIDKVFVDMIRDGINNVPILDGLISIARDLGADIVAEGVESQAQLKYLREHGVRQAQGFLFSPAVRHEDFIKLAKGLNLPAELKLIKTEKVA